MITRARPETPTQEPSSARNPSGIAASSGASNAANTPSPRRRSALAASVPMNRSARALPFSSMMALASSEVLPYFTETSMPVAFSNASTTGSKSGSRRPE
jgi:hypothetical protein